jgi:hypothetical protein
MTIRGARRALAAGLALGVAACGGGGGGGAPPLHPGPPPPVVAQDRASVLPSPEEAAVEALPGAFAADYLRGTHFTTLVVEIDHPASRAPSPEAVDFLRQRLLERCDKADVLVVVDDAIPDDRFPPVVSLADAQEIEDESRDSFADESTGTAVAYLLYVRGISAQDGTGGRLLGVTHRGGSIAIYASNVDSSADAFYTALEFEAHTLVHEFGHLLGLVDGGVPMVSDHRDPRHPFHSNDRDCVMYWLIGGLGGSAFGEPGFAQFGPNASADLAAFGGR